VKGKPASFIEFYWQIELHVKKKSEPGERRAGLIPPCSGFAVMRRRAGINKGNQQSIDPSFAAMIFIKIDNLRYKRRCLSGHSAGKARMIGKTVRRRRRIAFSVLSVAFGSVIGIATLEGLLLLINPQVSLFPRWEHSPEYGLILPKNARMIHRRPGKWKFAYSINRHGFRGEPVPLSSSYEKWNIVILGDSYSMGIGTNDGEEYPAIMAERLRDEFDVVNLAVAGWGLTHQTRVFFEFGQLYAPDIVILQYCVNDPGDNLLDRVADVENSRFVFRDTDRPIRALQVLLSNSRIVQNSQLYSFARKRFEAWKAARHAAVNRSRTADERPGGETPEEEYYDKLLEAFARELNRRGATLLMISVNAQLGIYPHVRAAVQRLESQGLITYLEVEDWLRGESGYESPEGHEWGAKAHRIIGERLAEYILSELRLKREVALKGNSQGNAAGE